MIQQEIQKIERHSNGRERGKTEEKKAHKKENSLLAA